MFERNVAFPQVDRVPPAVEEGVSIGDESLVTGVLELLLVPILVASAVEKY